MVKKERERLKREQEFWYLNKIDRFQKDFDKVMNKAEKPSKIKKKYEGLAKELNKQLIIDAESIRENKNSNHTSKTDENI